MEQDKTNTDLINGKKKIEKKAEFLLQELKKEKVDEISIDQIREEQFQALDSSLKGRGGMRYIINNPKYRKTLAKVEKSKNTKSKIIRVIKYYFYSLRARRFVYRGKYFFAQELFEEIRESNQGTGEREVH